MTEATQMPSETSELSAPATDERVAPRVLDAPAASLLAWCLLALLNQILILVQLPSVPGRTRAAHALYDLGQLLALGAISYAVVLAARYGLSKLTAWPRLRRFLPALGLTLAVFALSMAIVGEDVMNVAERYEIKASLANVSASLVFALALGAASLVRFRHLALRAPLALLGLALAVANALVLENDYFATHFMVAWLGAILLTNALAGLPLAFSPRNSAIAAGVLGAASVISLARPPSSEVLRRLYSLPSSVVAPLIARFLPEQSGAALNRVPAVYLKSPWFRSRSQLAPVGPTRAVVPPEPPLVILLTIDAVRADVLENPEYEQYLPTITELKKTSAYFTLARSPTPATTTTMASLFTGRYYSQLRWAAEGDSMVKLMDPGARFPKLLDQAGVKSIHAASQGRIRGTNGVGEGFSKEIWIPKSKVRGADQVDALIAELEQAPNRPTFIYTHFMEPHAPYDLAGKKGKPIERYVREIGLVDKEIKRLRQWLNDKGMLKRAVFIISADHGEAFGEHHTRYHAVSAYEELLRVPMIIHVPGLSGRRIDSPVSLIDVGPTVLDLFGVPTPGSFMGESLMPLVAGKATSITHPIAADTGRHLQVLYLQDGKKVINDIKRHTIEVYDLKADPKELVNLIGKDDESVEEAVETTKLFFEVHRNHDPGYKTPWMKF